MNGNTIALEICLSRNFMQQCCNQPTCTNYIILRENVHLKMHTVANKTCTPQHVIFGENFVTKKKKCLLVKTAYRRVCTKRIFAPKCWLVLIRITNCCQNMGKWIKIT